MSRRQFEVSLDEDAAKEYERLEGSLLKIVNHAIDELEYRADEVGKPLGNHIDTLHSGCKEIKLRNAGIRIVFRITKMWQMYFRSYSSWPSNEGPTIWFIGWPTGATARCVFEIEA